MLQRCFAPNVFVSPTDAGERGRLKTELAPCGPGWVLSTVAQVGATLIPRSTILLYSIFKFTKMLKARKSIPPHLVERDGEKACSACGIRFNPDGDKSISKAFAAHVRKDHRQPQPAAISTPDGISTKQ